MDTLVQIPGGNPNGRRKYFLNNEATAKKLKQAATNPDIMVETKGKSISIDFSTGSYVATVLPLVKAWQEIEGDTIDKDLVDGMSIKVKMVETKQDLGAQIVGYLVKLDVEGTEVTIHLYDTTLSLLVQASLSVLQPYCSRALVPYLEKQITLCIKKIKQINDKAKNIIVPRKPSKAAKYQKLELLRGSPSHEMSATPRTLSSPATPAASLVALPWAGNIEAKQQQKPEILIQAQNLLELPPFSQLPPRQMFLSSSSTSVRNLHPPRSPSSPQVAPRNEAGPPYIQEAGSPYSKEASPP